MTDSAMSPAQKVLTALYCNYDHEPTRRSIAAAALRAAADEVVPHEEAPFMEGEDHAIRWEQVQHTRRELLAIAAELEAQS
jgi:hypothetical protein